MREKLLDTYTVDRLIDISNQNSGYLWNYNRKLACFILLICIVGILSIIGIIYSIIYYNGIINFLATIKTHNPIIIPLGFIADIWLLYMFLIAAVSAICSRKTAIYISKNSMKFLNKRIAIYDINYLNRYRTSNGLKLELVLKNGEKLVYNNIFLYSLSAELRLSRTASS